MVHAFMMKGRFIAYDSESAALHELDQTAYDVLNLYIDARGQKPDSASFAGLQAAKG